MPTRYTVSVQYGSSGVVGVEIDISYVTPKEFDKNENVRRWRNPNGTFATAPDVTSADDLRDEAARVQSNVAGNMRSHELADAIRDASIDAVEDGELVGSAGGMPDEEIVNVTRIDADGDGEVDHRYTWKQGRLRRFD